MTLGRLVLAWLLVAIWFGATRYWLEVLQMRRAAAAIQRMAPGDERSVAEAFFPRAALLSALGESVVLTLLASLWFDSLGHGGWWLVFLLLGLLQSLPPLLYHRSVFRRVGSDRLLLAALGAVRYVGAGAILAWRLG